MKAERNALVIGAHFDDCECGSAAGTSLKLVKAGWNVVFLNTIGDRSEACSFKDTEGVFQAEAEAAARILGAEKKFLNYKHNKFMPEDRNTVTDMACLIQKINPELVFIPWPNDNHYDHARTAVIAMEALSYINRFAGTSSIELRLKEIIAYEISSWQTRNFTPDFYINIESEMEVVVKSINTFKFLGQNAINYYVNEKLMRSASWAAVFGLKYVEGLKHLGPQFPIKSILPEVFGNDLLPMGSMQYPWGANFFSGL